MTICNYPSCEHICSFASWQSSYTQRDSQLLIQPGANEFPSARPRHSSLLCHFFKPDFLLLPNFPFLSCIFPQGQTPIQDRFSKVATEGGENRVCLQLSYKITFFRALKARFALIPPVQECAQPLENSRMVLQDGNDQEKWDGMEYFPGRDLQRLSPSCRI